MVSSIPSLSRWNFTSSISSLMHITPRPPGFRFSGLGNGVAGGSNGLAPSVSNRQVQRVGISFGRDDNRPILGTVVAVTNNVGHRFVDPPDRRCRWHPGESRASRANCSTCLRTGARFAVSLVDFNSIRCGLFMADPDRLLLNGMFFEPLLPPSKGRLPCVLVVVVAVSKGVTCNPFKCVDGGETYRRVIVIKISYQTRNCLLILCFGSGFDCRYLRRCLWRSTTWAPA